MNCISTTGSMPIMAAPMARADHGRLADRRVDDPLRAEAVEEAGGDAEGAAVGADVLAEHEDPLVLLHLVPAAPGGWLRGRSIAAIRPSPSDRA